MDNDNIGARIAAIIKALNMKKVHFAERLKIDQSYVTQLTNGRRSPSERLISTICREFNVDENWLRTGEGEMFLETPDTAMGQLAKELGLDEFMQGVVSEYLKLNEEQRTVVRNFVYKIAEQPIKEPAVPTLAPAHTPTIEEEARSEAEEYYREILEEKKRAASASAFSGSAANEGKWHKITPP